MKKYFVFGDCHGNFDALHKGLTESGFDEGNDEHIIVGCGDYFDRGNQNLEVFEFLNDYYKRNRALLILGNHDQFLIDYLIEIDDGVFNAKYNGMAKTISNFSKLPINTIFDVLNEETKASIKAKNPELLPFLLNLKDSFSIGKYFFTHAGYSNETGDWVLDNFSVTPEFIKNYPVDKEKIYVFGHWHSFDLNDEFLGKKEDYSIFMYQNFIGVDSCTIMTKKVNIFVFEETKV